MRRTMHVGLARVIWAEYIVESICEQSYQSLLGSSQQSQIQHQREHGKRLLEDVGQDGDEYVQHGGLGIDGYSGDQQQEHEYHQSKNHLCQQNLEPVSTRELAAALENHCRRSVLENRDRKHQRQRHAHDDTRNDAQHVTGGLQHPRNRGVHSQWPYLGEAPAKRFVESGRLAGFEKFHQRVDERRHDQYVAKRAEQQCQQFRLPINGPTESQLSHDLKRGHDDKNDPRYQPEMAREQPHTRGDNMHDAEGVDARKRARRIAQRLPFRRLLWPIARAGCGGERWLDREVSAARDAKIVSDLIYSSTARAISVEHEAPFLRSVSRVVRGESHRRRI